MPYLDSAIHLWFPNIFEFKGGIQVYIQDLLQAINQEFPDQNFVVFDKLDQRQPDTSPDFDKIDFRFSGHVPYFWRTPHFAINLIQGALSNRPNLIVCGHINFSPVAFWIYRFTGIPYWILVYGVDAWNVTDKWKIQGLQGAEKIVSISEYTRDRLIEEQSVPPDKITILPVTFDASRFEIGQKPNYLLERYGLKPEQPIILTVARLASADRYKGYDQILQSLPKIRQHIPTIHYILVGKGSDRPRIEQLITHLNLQDCVTLTGFIPDDELGDYYNLCDVFAMPSKGEGFGIVYLEALACGKPTLGGNRDGAVDALSYGELGALVDPDNIDQIATTLIEILQGSYSNYLIYQPQMLRQKVIERFGFERFKQTLNNYLHQHLDD
ncbi:MAG TPA: glycosyltransferase [Cyanobacteria bacterium UBA12227]|nr:glycosyltransferase [Cyanobacteria bacterium UBA12227]HAX88428.1 glycosyltransferase [Cyanobacteria bacterium UBA11370]HBY80596.1 glycosyltransferase [Cyanobacteria bacterium UBA11148]